MNDELRYTTTGQPAIRDPEELEARGAPVDAEISSQTTIGSVELTVADLDRSRSYYETAVGLATRAHENGRASLGTAERELLVLVEQPGAQPADGYTGLYHFALLVPERVDLARWLAHAVRDGVELTGLSDHYVSEAIYLRDPDHHGIEIYADRPREVWEGQVAERMTTLPLNVPSLIGELPEAEAGTFDGLPAGTVMGHVHLRVATIDETVGFYRDLLGMGLMASLGPYAAFLSAGGYHHHLGANTWESAGAPPPPAGSATLSHYSLLVPDRAELDRVLERLRAAGVPSEEHPAGAMVRDPSQNAVLLRIA